MNQENRPKSPENKKVIAFPTPRLHLVPPPEPLHDPSVEAPDNVHSLKERRDLKKLQELRMELHTNLRDLPGDEFDEDDEILTEDEDGLGDQFDLFKTAFFKEMMYAGVSQKVSKEIFDSIALHILSYEETTSDAMERLQSMTAEECDAFFQKQWSDLRNRYRKSFPNARLDYVPSIPEKHSPPPSLLERFDEWCRKLFSFLSK